VISLWLWLSLRFEEHFFPGREQISTLNRQLITWMNEGLTAAADADAEAEAVEGAAMRTQSLRQAGSNGKGKKLGPVIDIRSYKLADGSAAWGNELLLEPLYDSSMAAFIYKPPLDAQQKGLLVVP
jgi:hypothetical protein